MLKTVLKVFPKLKIFFVYCYHDRVDYCLLSPCLVIDTMVTKVVEMFIIEIYKNPLASKLLSCKRLVPKTLNQAFRL